MADRMHMTLGQWTNVAALLASHVVDVWEGKSPMTQPEVDATLEVLEGIGAWQQYFAVDGESAANEVLGIDIPAGLPFRIEGVWDEAQGR